jgi:enamine deaminase RidA (YjgF/YER057c/UK114 family)
MARDIIRTPNAPSPPPTYSQAVRAAGLVFVSGTGPHDPVTGKIVGDTIQEQTRAVSAEYFCHSQSRRLFPRTSRERHSHHS